MGRVPEQGQWTAQCSLLCWGDIRGLSDGQLSARVICVHGQCYFLLKSCRCLGRGLIPRRFADSGSCHFCRAKPGNTVDTRVSLYCHTQAHTLIVVKGSDFVESGYPSDAGESQRGAWTDGDDPLSASSSPFSSQGTRIWKTRECGLHISLMFPQGDCPREVLPSF